MSMRTVVAVLLRGGFILCAMIFCSSLMVTLISRYRQKQDLDFNPAWLSRKWLITLLLGFGTPVAALGAALVMRGASVFVGGTLLASLVLGFFLGRNAEFELRDR
ncbi:MAG: hypothetical protein IK027_00695, partial [Deltaproteobacteria bacterium]|nr:hypothetical protein [Deltaproteobacteria bacterium]